jgi:D-citramalate synthase
MNPMQSSIQILDVTLRDGEQTQGVSFTTDEKLNIAKFLLQKLNVHRVEIASARVSQGELQTVRRIMDWAETEGLSQRIEILGFVDGGKTVDWMVETGVSTLNLLTKGSLHHLEKQLRKTPQEHFKEVSDCIKRATEKGYKVNVYLEDWSPMGFSGIAPEICFWIFIAHLKQKKSISIFYFLPGHFRCFLSPYEDTK